jgi:hypothetical protein
MKEGKFESLLREYEIQLSDEDECPTNIVGGLADKMSIEDIAKKHNKSVEEIRYQLEIGIDIEFEHTEEPRDSDSSKDKDKKISVATEIAMDHISEDPEYYTKLTKMEKQFTGDEDESDEEIEDIEVDDSEEDLEIEDNEEVEEE